MRITKWTTVDVAYNKNEQNAAKKERKRLERLGYEYQQTDEGALHDYNDQYIKSGKIRIIKQGV